MFIQFSQITQISLIDSRVDEMHDLDSKSQLHNDLWSMHEDFKKN
jgi:hypothetical protein